MMNANQIRKIMKDNGIDTYKLHDRTGISPRRIDVIISRPRFMTADERELIESVLTSVSSPEVTSPATSENDDSNMAEIVKKKIIENKISIKHLSDVSGVARGTISNLINGKRSSQQKTLQILSVNVDKIIEGKMSSSPIKTDAKVQEDRAVRVETKSTPVPVYKRFDDARKLLVLTFSDGSYLELYGLLNSGVRGIYYNASISKEEKINYDTKLDNKESVRKIKSIHFIEELFREIGLSIDNYLDEIGTIAGL